MESVLPTAKVKRAAIPAPLRTGGARGTRARWARAMEIAPPPREFFSGA